MKLFKKMIAFVGVAALLVATMAGCGSSGTANTESSETAAASAEASAAPAAEAASTEASSAVEAASAATETAAVKTLGTDPIRIAYIPLSTAGVVNNMIKMAFEDTIDAYKETVEINYFDPNYDVQTQITMLNDCVTQGYDVILTECMDPVAMATPIEDAEKAGIPVITINCAATTTYTLHIRGVDYLSGWKAAETLASQLDPNADLKVVIVDFPAAMLATALQSTGFLDYMEANTSWELIDQRCIDNISQEGANTAVRDLLTKYDDIDIIFNSTDDLTAGTIQAVRAAGRDDGSITIYGNYGTPVTFEDLMADDGLLCGLNFCDYYTEYCTAMSYALYHAVTGATAVTMGLDKTPEIALSVFPITKDQADVYSTLSRWNMALEYNS